MRALDEPWLLFFRRTPDELKARPPLASSLQSFESCLFLISLMRYPHALTACASAIESALKVGRARTEQRRSLQDLLVLVRNELPSLAILPQARLDEFRILRNRIIHFGFHERDDAIAASALLLTGLPLLISVHEKAFGFDLCDALLPPFGVHLTKAIEVHRRQQPTNVGAVASLSVLGHLTRWSFRESMMAGWELHALDPTESYDLQMDTVMRLREAAKRQLEPSWAFDCPVCEGEETLVCKLNEELLDQKRIELSACFCAECGLKLSGAAVPILNAVCAEQVDSARDRLFSEYGID